MKTLLAATVAGLALAALPLSGFANEREMSLTDLAPVPAVASPADAVATLLLDPWTTDDMSIELPQGYVTLDPNTDPFSQWSPN
jgi:hypothetical protein